MNREILLFILLGVLIFPVFGQKRIQRDSLVAQGDTTLIQSYAERFQPKKALLFAAVFPGLGQVYNKKYWKLPLVYGGFIVIGYALTWYNDLYRNYKGQLFYILETGNPFSLQGYTEVQLRPAIDRVRRERDLMIALMGGMYILQIVDALVDAHLKEFDVNPNLQVKLKPSLNYLAFQGTQAQLSLIFTF